jgi:hypothetical protein
VKILLIVAATAIVGCSTQTPILSDAENAALASPDNPFTDPQMQEFLKRYREVVRDDGNTMYCTSRTPTGSRMARTVCLTANEIALEKERTREVLRHMQGSQPPPLPPENVYRPQQQ